MTDKIHAAMIKRRNEFVREMEVYIKSMIKKGVSEQQIILEIEMFGQQ